MDGAKLGENIAREWSEEPQAPALWKALQLVKCDPHTGIEALELLASDGSCLAKMYLGNMYLSGKHGVRQNLDVGEYWLRRSAEEGSIEGAYGLAWHLLNIGQTDAALAEYDRLSDLGYPPALYILGVHFYNGEIVERNLSKALQYFLRGEAKGHFFAAKWACRLQIRGEMGLCARFLSLAKMLALTPSFLRTVLTYPNSERLRI
ncbi:sel1 repeat family protein [Novosphingobium flavum]|uniref:Sel1 repeat family protein n=1 Tax=Novosphingobium flavum TaxID=1778672 RepID=A0A7X1FU44_9SPHN|nr:tetratricopeptide repeat protein [Novosphingobium flavum]MBC2667025.1 sel1 repeat family protein [Novosphingobium flavum]